MVGVPQQNTAGADMQRHVRRPVDGRGDEHARRDDDGRAAHRLLGGRRGPCDRFDEGGGVVRRAVAHAAERGDGARRAAGWCRADLGPRGRSDDEEEHEEAAHHSLQAYGLHRHQKGLCKKFRETRAVGGSAAPNSHDGPNFAVVFPPLPWVVG